MPAWVRRLFATTPRIASLDDLFGIDVRALGVIRILIGATVLYELAIRAVDLPAFYGNLGVLPVEEALSYWDPQWVWSFHLFWDGATPYVAALFVIHAIAALALLLGYKTRLATIVTWFFYVSLVNANSLIVSGDVLLLPILFVGMFLPWGRIYSLDSRGVSDANSYRVVSAWTAAFLLQIGFLYFFAALYKEGAQWVSEGSAVYYALSDDSIVTAFGSYLLHFPAVLQFLTFAIVIFQHVVLFLLFFPFFSASLRIPALAGAMFLHLSFIATLHLGTFSFIMLIALLAFVPSAAWEWLEKRMPIRARLGGKQERGNTIPSGPKKVGVTIAFALGVCYILYVFCWQAASVPRLLWPFPEDLVPIAKVLRIDQRWRLFSPYPPTNDGWMIGLGTTVDGSKVDVIRRQPISYEKPETIAVIYGSERWRKYIWNIVSQNYAPYYEYYADHLCRSWNETHAELERVEQVSLIYMLEETPPPGTSIGEPVPQRLLTWNCQGRYSF